MNVHNQLWPGLLEKFISDNKWIKKKWYDVKEQRVEYKINDDVVGTGYVDLIINDVVALELKSTKVTKWIIINNLGPIWKQWKYKSMIYI